MASAESVARQRRDFLCHISELRRPFRSDCGVLPAGKGSGGPGAVGHLPSGGTEARALGIPAGGTRYPALETLELRRGAGPRVAASSRAGPRGGALRAGTAAPPPSAELVGLRPGVLITAAQ